MKTKIALLLTICFTTFSALCQTNLNNYKYVVIPKKFDFLKEADQYQLNSLTEFLFNKYGFLALMEGSNYPKDALNNRCIVLKSNLLNDGSMFKTKLAVELKNCNDQVVYTSDMGESREKVYQKAYAEALRNAFNSIEALKHKFEPSSATMVTESMVAETIIDTNLSNEVEQLRQQVQKLKEEKKANVIETTTEALETKADAVIEKVGLDILGSTSETANKPNGSVLYAQAIENGFQLVDSTPKVVYKIKKTSIPDVYLVENKNATLSKKDTYWILEFYENNVLVQEVLDIKF